MPLLTDQNKKQVQKVLEQLSQPVRLHYFTQEFECEPCQITHELLREVTALSDKLALKVYEFKNEHETAQRFGVDKIPAIPIHIQVFVTPTCPYCPSAVRMAHKMALYSDKITADMVSALEFPYLADKYEVYGVPKTVVNDGEVMFEGALPEREFVAHVLRAA